MICDHDLVEREVAAHDGMCPLCLLAEIERLRADWKPDRGSLVEYQLLAEAQDDNERLRALLGKLRWKSIDKDNMEFRCDTTCHVVDEIRRALEPKMNNDTATYHARQERGDGHMPPGEGAAFANGAAARQPEIDRLCAERLAFATESEERKAEIERLRALAQSMLEALEGVVRVADRATVEFDAARAAIKDARRALETKP